MMTFDKYEFKKYIVHAINDLGFKELSPIQKLVLDNQPIDMKSKVIKNENVDDDEEETMDFM